MYVLTSEAAQKRTHRHVGEVPILLQKSVADFREQ